MAKIILVSGGSRSGKSSYAQKRCEQFEQPRLFVATSPRLDIEMEERIQKHVDDRKGRGWKTIEEQFNLVKIIEDNLHFPAILVDCLTLWINNLLYAKQQKKELFGESDLKECIHALIEKCQAYSGTIIFVTNEVGSGIVPESPETRHYRDLVGRCNQIFGQCADEVVLVCCGIPITVKPKNQL